MSVDPTIKKQKKGTVYFKCSCVADGGANRRSTDAPGPQLWGRGHNYLVQRGKFKQLGGGKEVTDGIIAVSTHCNAILDALEKKWFPGVQPLL